jgi:hypothetical protein
MFRLGGGGLRTRSEYILDAAVGSQCFQPVCREVTFLSFFIYFKLVSIIQQQCFLWSCFDAYRMSLSQYLFIPYCVGAGIAHSIYRDWLRAELPESQELSLHCQDLFWEPTQRPVQYVPGALSQGVKLPVREANHSLPASAEVKKRTSIHPLPNTCSWLTD